MSSLDRRRDNVARTQNARTNSSLSSRKDQIEKEIQTLLRGKTANMIDSSLQLSLLRRVAVLLPALIVEKTIDAELREMNKRLRNIEQNISKTTTAIEFYAAAAKIESRIEENATTTRLAKFNNLNQQRQLNELKKNKTLIYKIRKKNEKTKIRALFSKKLMKRIIRAEEQKNDVLTIRRLSSENIEILTRSVKTKQRLKQNKTLFKDIAMTTSLSRRTFEVMIHGVRIASINTRNQQKTIAHIIRQNASMHSNLKIARVIWSKRVKINSDKEYSSLIMKMYSSATTNRLIQEELLDEYSHRTCEYFDKDCRLKQCFNCQRYEHIDRSCKYNRRCAACADSHSESICNTSIERRKCVNCEKNHFVWSFQCKIRVDEKNRLNDMWSFKSILHAKKTREKNIAFVSRENQIASRTTTSSRKQVAAFAEIRFFFSKKKFSSFLSTEIMCLETSNYTMQKSLNKRSFSQRSNVAIFSLTARRRSVSVLQVISSQEVNNALTILRYRSSEKKSRERSKQLNADNTTTASTQNEELWVHSVR